MYIFFPIFFTFSVPYICVHCLTYGQHQKIAKHINQITLKPLNPEILLRFIFQFTSCYEYNKELKPAFGSNNIVEFFNLITFRLYKLEYSGK